MKHRAPQPYKKALKALIKKNRNKNEIIVKRGIGKLVSSIFTS